MKNRMRLAALLLCAAMVLAISCAAFAENTTAAASSSDGILDSAALQQMMDEFVAKYSLDTRNRSISVGFCYLKTGDMWFYNEGKWYYSASLYKVPVAMLLAEREVAGEIAADTVHQNQYYTGSLETLESKALVNSNNDAGHAMVEWMGGTYAGKCADQLKKFTDLPDSYFNEDFYSVSYYNVNFYTQVLRTLYNNQQNYPRIIDYMKLAQPGAYLRTYLDGAYEVAQKYGAFEETKTNPTKNNNHAAGIIFTPNPIAVTIMTSNVDNFNDRIGEVAKMLADYALTLDARYDSYMAEQARLAQEEAERAAREEQERLAAEEAARQAAAAAANPIPTIAPSQTNSSSGNEKTGTASGKSSGGGIFGLGGFFSGLESTQKLIIIAGIAVFLIGVALLIVALGMRRRRRNEEYDDYDDYEYDDYEDENYDDGYDYEDASDDDLTPPVTQRRSRPMTEHEAEYFDGADEADDGYYDAGGYAGEEDYSEGEEENWDEGDWEVPNEDQPDDYLTDQDFLANDPYLDESDYADFSDQFGADLYGAYGGADDEAEDTSSGGRSGGRYSPRH